MYEEKLQKFHISGNSITQVSEVVFWAHWIRFTAYYNCNEDETSKISYLREFSAQVTQIVFSDHLTRFPAYYYLYEDKSSKMSYISVKFSAHVSQIVF